MYSAVEKNLPKHGTLIGKLEKQTIRPKMCSRRYGNSYRMSGREGVRLYKTLHRTVQRVFRGDMAAMFAARDKVTTFCKQHPCRLLKVISSGVQ